MLVDLGESVFVLGSWRKGYKTMHLSWTFYGKSNTSRLSHYPAGIRLMSGGSGRDSLLLYAYEGTQEVC